MDDWCAVSDSLVWEVSMPPRLLLLDSPSLFSNFPLSSSLAFSFSTPSVCFPIYLHLPLPVSTKHPAFLSQHFLFFLSEALISLPFFFFYFYCFLLLFLFAFLYVLFSSSSLCHILPPKLFVTQWLVCLSVAKSSWLSLCCTLQISNIPCTVWYDVSHCRLTKSLWILYHFLEGLLERSA